MDDLSKKYFERRASEEAAKARSASTREVAATHRELERLYLSKLANDSDGLVIATES